MKKRLLALLVSAMLTIPILPITSFAKSKIVIKVTTIAPPKTPWVTHLEKWRDNLLKATNGEIEVKIFPGGQMGNEFDTIKMARRGRIDAVGSSGAGVADLIPEFSLMSTPFLFDKVETIDCIYDKELNGLFRSMVEEKKLKVLQWQETGWVYIYAKENLSDPDTAKGYKIRVAPHAMSRTLWSAVSANGIELPYVETPSALQTGMVRGGESSAIGYIAFGLTKVAPHFMKTRHFHQAGAIMINAKQWKQFSI